MPQAPASNPTEASFYWILLCGPLHLQAFTGKPTSETTVYAVVGETRHEYRIVCMVPDGDITYCVARHHATVPVVNAPTTSTLQ